jgi:hypothetical protein
MVGKTTLAGMSRGPVLPVHRLWRKAIKTSEGNQSAAPFCLHEAAKLLGENTIPAHV